MKHLFTAVALLISFCAFAQEKQQRRVADFTAISGATGIEIELTHGNENAVWVSASDNKYLEYLVTDVENGTLKVYYNNKDKKFDNERNKKLKAFITYKSINKLTGSSGTIITAKNTIPSSSFTLDMSSGAMFNGEIKTDDLTIDQSSGAITKVSGTASSVNADVSSGSILTGNDLSSETCKASASSGGILRIGVSKKLTAKASSGGIVNYKGNPEVEKSTSSGGVVSKI